MSQHTLNSLGAMPVTKETAKGPKQAKGTKAGHPHKNLGPYLHPKKAK